MDFEKRCDNCENLISIPRGNAFGDTDNLCIVNGYFMHGIHKPHDKYKHCSPGGRELECEFKPKEQK